jgi:hypothetical protein
LVNATELAKGKDAIDQFIDGNSWGMGLSKHRLDKVFNIQKLAFLLFLKIL